MKKALYRAKNPLYYFKDGVRVLGAHDLMWGDVTGIYGNVSDIVGNVSGIVGNVSGIVGDASGLHGNLDECDITDEERKNGVLITDLIHD